MMGRGCTFLQGRFGKRVPVLQGSGSTCCEVHGKPGMGQTVLLLLLSGVCATPVGCKDESTRLGFFLCKNPRATLRFLKFPLLARNAALPVLLNEAAVGPWLPSPALRNAEK